jgi:iron complex transport system substrate-binding protein
VAARAQKLTALVAIAILVFLSGAPRAQNPAPDSAPKRIVSLVPAITEMLFAIGAGPQVVAVSSFDEFPAEVKSLPTVGALLDPDTERILSLRPDLVIVYGSQSDLEMRLHRAGIRTFGYRHGGMATTLGTIRDLGAATGHRQKASALVSSLRSRLDAVRSRVKGRPRPRTLLVFERQPGTLREIYASGGTGFLNDMLDVAGGTNVFADVARESVQPSVETLLARAPDVIVEVRAQGLIDKNPSTDQDPWSVLPSVPAVRNRRVHRLTGAYLVVPGPRLGIAAEAFARALHPDAFE